MWYDRLFDRWSDIPFVVLGKETKAYEFNRGSDFRNFLG